jgi:3-oxo-5alpha-steroid 4-dehydrogenase
MAEKQVDRKWNAEVDVIVVGFGGAGACAALEAAQQGASVLVLDRFCGGGATAGSGAIIYAGGGTEYQKAAGFEDTPDEMYKYLRQEISDCVSDETLRRFCNGSVDMIKWLAEAGVPFEGSMCPFKTSYPTDAYYIYFSGSENNGKYKAKAKPAPRGHRAKGKGISGLALFHSLEKTIHKNDKIRVSCQTNVQKLVIDNGRVIGVEGRIIKCTFFKHIHKVISKINLKATTYCPPGAQLMNGVCTLIEKTMSRPYRAHALKGVILSAGGFIFNREMVKKHNPVFLKCLPLGTYGDDGSGIHLGESAGGVTAYMDKMSAWRFYVPPEALMQGVLVDKQGQRVCAEDLYGGKQGEFVVSHGGKAYLIMDSDTYKEAVSHLVDQCAGFQKLTQIPSVRFTRKTAPTLAKLAKKIGASPEGLEATMKQYNEIAEKGQPDPLGKFEKRFKPQVKPPFYSVDCSLMGFKDTMTRAALPTAALTLGGLVVDEQTGQVKRKDGSKIEGLYAAGRNAVGLCSNGYFASGTSIADCIFAGRRAAQHAIKQQAK